MGYELESIASGFWKTEIGYFRRLTQVPVQPSPIETAGSNVLKRNDYEKTVEF